MILHYQKFVLKNVCATTMTLEEFCDKSTVYRDSYIMNPNDALNNQNKSRRAYHYMIDL